MVSAIAYFLSSRAHNSVNSQPICTILASKIISIILGTGLSFFEPAHVVLIFQYFIKRRTIFLRHPVVGLN